MIRLSLTAAAFLAMCSPAHAQQQQLCGPVDTVMAGFKEEHGETPAMTGLSQRGYVLAVVVNPATGGFSVFRVTADGLACIIDAGMGARLFVPETPGEPS